MNIEAPINSISEVLPLIKSGASELYCGVLDKPWISKYSYLATTSSRNNPYSHLKSINELKEVLRIAHSHSAQVFLTVNELMYTQSQYSLILKLIEKALNSGIDGFIIADVALLVRLRKIGFKGKIHISLRGTTFNSETVAFYKKLGCEYINLPEHLRIKEIKNIVDGSLKNVKFATVILNGKCANVCGFCLFHHGVNNLTLNNKKIFDLVCFKDFEIYNVEGPPASRHINSIVCRNVQPKDRDYGFTHCGVCALWDFYKIGISSVKIVGRGFPLEKKIKDVQFVSKALNLIKRGNVSKKKFIELIKQQYLHTYRGDCKLYCYYYADISH